MNKALAFLFILVSLTLICCQSADKTVRDGEPDIYNLDSEDKEMNDAVRKGRASFESFVTAFKTQDGRQSSFTIKVAFEVPNGHEHIWLSDIRMNDNKIFGTIDNEPETATNIALGDEVEIDSKQISDWFYIEDDSLDPCLMMS